MIIETKKFVINLKRRPDRLDLVKKEFDYIGFDNVEIFEGVDKSSHVGCALSHLEIIKKAIDLKLENVIVFEDDIIFMPYAKSLIADINNVLQNISFSVLNFNPSIHRPLNISKENNLLIDLTNKPPKNENHRGVFGTGFMIYNKSIYEKMFEYNDYYAIDEFLENEIYSKYQSYTSILPICCQSNNISDVSGGNFYNNFYTQSYNWNNYCPQKIPQQYTDQDYVLKNRKVGIDYKTLLYVS
jgi:GR25 family glycosyltransferase involved in LPS biosynthesis